MDFPLHDGTSVHLDKITDSSSFIIGSTRIENNKGTVTFTSDDKSSEAVEYNTLSVPRNGEYHIVLNDGTAVWLNAESSLKFPTRFEKGKRHVILSGEAYFQVSRDTSSPFVVETNLGEIKVYGTEFNVRRNLDERTIRVTLVNGSVGFCASGCHPEDFKMIEPGYQAYYEIGKEVIVKKVKVFNEIAWHKQLFCFEHCPLDEIMTDVARWYDVEVSFDDENLKELYFTCTLDRYDKIEKLLRFFEEVHDITFKIKGKQVTVIKK